MNPTYVLKGTDTLYKKIGTAAPAGSCRRSGAHPKVFYHDLQGNLFYRSEKDFESRMELKCSHDTCLGNSKTRRIQCASCGEVS